MPSSTTIRYVLPHLALSWARTLGSMSCACIEAARVSGGGSMAQPSE